MAQIGFIGLGAMGSRMATRLIAVGHTLTVYNRTPAATAALQKQGATLATTPREVALQSDILFSMVYDDAASHSVWLAPTHGAIHGLRPGSIAIECSTLSPAYVGKLAHQCNAIGAAFLDAPVAGSLMQAEAGTLIFMVGGNATTLEQVHPILMTMGGTAHHVGPNEAGATMKLAVNSLFTIQVAALAETLGWLKKAGITPHDAITLLNTLPTTSTALQGFGKLMATENDTPLFTIGLVTKDLRYAIEIAGTSAPLANTAQRVYTDAAQRGLSESNITAIRNIFVPA